MLFKNFTEGEEGKALEQMFCSANLTDTIHDQLPILAVLNIFLSITAFLGNILILVALHKESSLHPPSKLLFRSLATTDLCVGLISEPLNVVSWISAHRERWDICRYAIKSSVIAGYSLVSVSLLTLTAISVDRLLALMLRLRYRNVVTLRRAYVIVVGFWVVSTIASIMSFWNYLITATYGQIVQVLCLITTVFSYTRIFFILRHHDRQVHNQVRREQPSGQTTPMNIARYRKAVSSALWLQLTLVVCYLPVGVVETLSTRVELSPSVLLAREFTITLVYLNSSINPILYCWKIREVNKDNQ